MMLLCNYTNARAPIRTIDCIGKSSKQSFFFISVLSYTKIRYKQITWLRYLRIYSYKYSTFSPRVPLSIRVCLTREPDAPRGGCFLAHGKGSSVFLSPGGLSSLSLCCGCGGKFYNAQDIILSSVYNTASATQGRAVNNRRRGTCVCTKERMAPSSAVSTTTIIEEFICI